MPSPCRAIPLESGRFNRRSSTGRAIVLGPGCLSFQRLIADVLQKVTESDDSARHATGLIAELLEESGNLQARGNFVGIRHVGDLRNPADDHEFRLLCDVGRPSSGTRPSTRRTPCSSTSLSMVAPTALITSRSRVLSPSPSPSRSMTPTSEYVSAAETAQLPTDSRRLSLGSALTHPFCFPEVAEQLQNLFVCRRRLPDHQAPGRADIGHRPGSLLIIPRIRVDCFGDRHLQIAGADSDCGRRGASFSSSGRLAAMFGP